MRRMRHSDQDESPPGRTGYRGWRRLAVLAVAPLLALPSTAASAQGVWLTLPQMPTARAYLAGAAAKCPEGLHGTCVYAVGADAKLEAYSPAVGTWATLPPLKTPRSNLASTTAPCPGGVRGDCVYAIGGLVGGTTPVTAVEAYSTETNAWLSLPSLPGGPRASLGAATAPCPTGVGGLRGTCVYALGGTTLTGADPILTRVEAYSPATNTWATVSSLQTARSGLGATGAPCPGDLGLRGTCVYAVGGGNTGDAALITAEVYSPELDGWQPLPDMPTERGLTAAATAPCPDGMTDGCVYAVGGTNGTDNLAALDAYSPVTNAWVTLPPMPTARRALAAAAAPCPKTRKSDCVYALGGLPGADETPTSKAEAFAIEGSEQRPGSDQPPQRPTQPGAVTPPGGGQQQNPGGQTWPDHQQRPPAAEQQPGGAQQAGGGQQSGGAQQPGGAAQPGGGQRPPARPDQQQAQPGTGQQQKPGQRPPAKPGQKPSGKPGQKPSTKPAPDTSPQESLEDELPFVRPPLEESDGSSQEFEPSAR
ncbi:Kelch repeat-containing protein [Streptomyces sp. CB03578]|uniref:Kelch repeat-containing protein n=1 Tax=Streptomyces sp. CB03578 TaxID=1718987 RepID=UPI0009A11BBA|nr:kelch repeat-containing protein [Streptomyces sp. CB03578]